MTTLTDQPTYFIQEAARYLRLPVSTVRAWSVGRKDGQRSTSPLITPADSKYPLLSFSNLVELHILASLRHVHGLSPKPVRKAIDFLKRKLGVERPLLDQAMLTDGKSLFIHRVGELMNISEGGQLQLKDIIEVHLQRIERNRKGISIRFYPFTRTRNENTPTLIAIDPVIRSGHPCITGTRISTELIASRYRAGDSISFLAKDYERKAEEIEEAIRYESRAAA
jgi:uncharacterized protein (DUF433 family)